MGKSGTAGIRVTDRGSDVGRNGRTDVLTEHHGGSSREGDPTHAEHDQRQGHCSTRRLKNERQNRTDHQENQHRAKAHVGPLGDELQHLRRLTQVGYRVLHQRKTEEEQRETDDKLAHVAVFFFFGQTQHETYGHQRNRQDRDIGLKAQECNKPCGDRRTDIGTHNHTHGLSKGQKTGIYETNHHDGRGT